MDEARRSVRVAAKFLAGIEGIDERPLARIGNISTTGIYFQTAADAGDVGMVQWIVLASLDRSRTIRIMAHVVRKVTLDDGHGVQAGVAFEFMPESDEALVALQDFVVHALEQRDAPPISPRLDAVATGTAGSDIAARRPAEVRQLTVRSLTLETSWPVARGETVSADISAPGVTRRIRVKGKATQVTRVSDPVRGSRYLIEIEVEEEADGPVRRRSSMNMRAVTPADAAAAQMVDFEEYRAENGAMDAEDDGKDTLDDLLSALVLPPPDSDRKMPVHMSGELSRVRLTALCALFSMERMSGELVLERGAERATIFVQDGDLLDMEPVPSGATPRSQIAAMLKWDAGRFHFVMCPVDRPNRIGMGTTALLLDIAREDDEASHR
jgi:hypothetical protein